MSRRFQTILCPIDFSDSSRLALQCAAAVARRFGARLAVLFVNDPLLASAAAVAYDERALAAQTLRELHQFAERAIGAQAAASATCLVALGSPAREIQKAARRLGCDLVVVGTRGLAGVGKLFVGSTTSQLLRHATVPILAVPHAGRRQKKKKKGLTSSWPRRVLAAVELNPHASASIGLASKVARMFGARLVVVTVVPAVNMPSWLSGNWIGADRARLADALERLQKLTSRIPKSLKTECRVLAGDAAEQIAAAAAATAASLTVMTLKQGGKLFGPRPGSTTYQVLSRTATPVLAMPAPARARRT